MDLAVNPIFKSFLAGSLSGTCSTILLQPLDLVKTRIQNLPSPPTAAALQSSTGTPGPPPARMLSVMRHVLATENVFGLWRGMTPSITRTVPGVGLYFSSLHWLKTQVPRESAEKPSPLEAVCLGMVARSFAGAVCIPITVIKTRFESGTYNYQRVSSALLSIYRAEGARGLCCGLVPTLFRDAPYSGLYLMFYTQLKQNIPLQNIEGDGLRLRAGAVHFSCGIMAGVLASLVTHPADVIKTKMQLHPARYPSVHTTALQVFSAHGPGGFLRGMAPRCLRRTLMSALAWTAYEEIMRRIGLK